MCMYFVSCIFTPAKSNMNQPVKYYVHSVHTIEETCYSRKYCSAASVPTTWQHGSGIKYCSVSGIKICCSDICCGASVVAAALVGILRHAAAGSSNCCVSGRYQQQQQHAAAASAVVCRTVSSGDSNICSIGLRR